MAKRGIVRVFCPGGFRHETRAEAKAYAANLARRGVVRGGIPKCQRCPECGGWHAQRRLGETPPAAGVRGG